MRKIKINIHTYLLFLSILLASISILNIIYNYKELYMIDSYGNEAINKESIYFSINGTESMDFSILTKQDIIDNATLLKGSKGNGLYYEVIYSCGKKDIFSGNYFVEDDFINNKKKAIIGKFIPECINVNPLYIYGTEYIVSDIIPFSQYLNINYSVFYTKGNIENVSNDEIFVISSSEHKYIETSFQNLKINLESKGMEVKKIDFRVAELNDFIHYHKGTIGLLILLVMLCITTITISIIFWMVKRKQEQRVYNIIGINGYFVDTIWKGVKTVSCSFIISIIISFFTHGNSIPSLNILFLLYTLFILIFILVICIYYLLTQKSHRR